MSKASGPSSNAPVICPRSAILQSAAASMVDGIFEVTVSTAERIATRGDRTETGLGEEIDGVLDDVAFGVEIGEDVDRGIGDEHGLGIGRHVHDEDMADAPIGAQSAGLCGDRAHQLVGVQAAFHQHLALAAWISSTPRLAAAASLSARRRRCRSLRCSRPCFAAVSLILAAGPTRMA